MVTAKPFLSNTQYERKFSKYSILCKGKIYLKRAFLKHYAVDCAQVQVLGVS